MSRLTAPLCVLACALAIAPATHAAGNAHRRPVSGGRCVPTRLNRSALLPGTRLAVSPIPGSYAASARTQISLLGSALRAVSLRVRGSRSGGHPGRLIAYSQGDGASFVPARPFTGGETVSVRGRLGTGRRSVTFAYSFVVAHQDALPHTAPHVPSERDPNEKMHFRTRPDLQPPSLAVTARSPQAAPGYIFASPYAGPGKPGPMIFDEAGNLVWFDPLPVGTEGTNLQVQTYAGLPVLTWWQGYIPQQGFGQGEDIIADSSYRQIGRVHAGNGYKSDLHEFEITPQRTALITVFDPVHCDLSGVGGRPDAAVTDSGFQEVDMGTGLVRREWHALDHVALAESSMPARGASTTWPFDFFHINSVARAPNGSTLISARNTSAMYQLGTVSGQVALSIGGKRSDLKLAAGAATAFQHDAAPIADGSTISVFDNGALPKVHRQSRGLIVSVNTAARTESVLAQYVHPTPLLAASQGNMQVLQNGDAFIGWGSEPYFSEFGPAGQPLFDAHMHGSYQSYRAYRFPWTGTPSEPPAVVATMPRAGGAATVYASWNGDTQTASWRVLAGPSPDRLTPVGGAPRSGFETAMATPAPAAYVAVQAVGSSGAVLATSRAVAPASG